MIIRDRHGGLQLLVALLASLYLANQVGPDIIQHLDHMVGLSSVDIELPQESDNRPHSSDQTLTLARLALVIRIRRLANTVAKCMAWVL